MRHHQPNHKPPSRNRRENGRPGTPPRSDQMMRRIGARSGRGRNSANQPFSLQPSEPPTRDGDDGTCVMVRYYIAVRCHGEQGIPTSHGIANRSLHVQQVVLMLTKAHLQVSKTQFESNGYNYIDEPNRIERASINEHRCVLSTDSAT